MEAFLQSFFTNLNTNFRDFVSFWESFEFDIFERKVADHPALSIDDVCMSFVVAFIVGFPIDSWETPEHSLLCHSLYIAIYGRATNLWGFFFDYLKDILRGEMSAFTGIADDISVLVRAHTLIMRKTLRIARFIIRVLCPGNLHSFV